MGESPGLGRLAARHLLIPLVGLALAAMASCSGESTSEPLDEASSTTTEAATLAPTSTTTSTTAPLVDPRPELDLSSDSLVFFGALPPAPEDVTYALPSGSDDYFDLFSPDADWQDALARIDAFRIHAFHLRHFIDDEQLVRILDWLDDNDVPLLFETEPLNPPDPDECNHSESFEGPYDLEMAQRVKDLGGTIAVVAIEQPYSYAHLLDAPGACQYTVERVVDEVIDYVSKMRAIFPGVPVGTIEAIWQTPESTADDMAIWLDTYQERSGEKLAFLHVDPDWNRPDWAQVAAEMQAVANSRGIPFGVLYNGGNESTGGAWMATMMDRIFEFEVVQGASPQHVFLISWAEQPDQALPEDDLSALTSIVNRYFGIRTNIEASPANGSDGSLGITATLTTEGGEPLADEPIGVSLLPLSGAPQTHQVTGVVPDGSRTALVAVRVNIEDATPGVSEVSLLEVGYEEDGDGVNPVPNASFTSGLDYWDVYGEPLGEVRLTSRDVGDGSQLSISASPDQIVLINGGQFAVTPGATFKFTAQLAVPEASIGTATVAIIFLAETEVGRHSIRFEPAAELRGSPLTDSEGTIFVGVDGPGSYVVRVDYAGDLDRWPAYTSVTVDVPPA
ncbi:MAG: hypothetical protein GY939_04475 [Actinomycetia bacterium]|nr:hypothetical protein [Actinomycetes bacterium]